MISVAMSAGSSAAWARSTTAVRSPSRPTARPKTTGVVAGKWRRRIAKAARELRRPRLRHRVVERDDEAGLRRRGKPPLDQCPRLEVVGERDGAEIVAERRADPRRDGEHGGDAGNDGEIDGAPCGVPGVDRLADRRRHGEDAGIAARDQRDARAGGRMVEGGSGAAELLAVVGGVAALAGSLRHAVEIGSVAVDGVGLVESGLCLAGEEAVIAGTETDDREPPAHDGRSRAGTSTTAK